MIKKITSALALLVTALTISAVAPSLGTAVNAAVVNPSIFPIMGYSLTSDTIIS